jgi:site-specific recombinase XerD
MTSTALITPGHRRLNDAFLRGFSSWWLSKGHAQSTLTQYLIQLRKLERTIDRSFREVDQCDLQEFILGDLQTNSASSAAFAARAVRKFYSYLCEEEEIESNPASRVRIPKVPVPPTKAASEEGIARMIWTTRHWKQRPTFLDLRDRALIMLLRSSGVRIGEAARVEVDHILIDQGALLVPKTKSGKPRMAGLDSQAIRALSLYLRRLPDGHSGPIWTTASGRVVGRNALQSALFRRARAAGVDITAHQLRRGYCASWLTDGGSQSGLQTTLGWTSPAMVQRYLSQRAGEVALSEYHRMRK